MVRGRIVLFVVVAVAVTLGASAGAGATGSAVQRIDLSSRSAIDKYLVSVGVDPAGVVVQRGARAYAGPNCPGKGWTCTRATRALQLATAQNKFECTPVAAQAGGTNQGSNTCFIEQFGPGKNEAKCSLENTDTTTPSSITQSCTINQTNAAADNVATVKMVITQTAQNGDQNAGQSAAVNQTNGSGANFSTIQQTIQQTENTSLVVVGQSQQSSQVYNVQQSAATGTQKSTAQQTQILVQNAAASQTGSQFQSSLFDGSVDQDSAGVSQSTNQQTEKQTQIAGTLAVDQRQVGPISC